MELWDLQFPPPHRTWPCAQDSLDRGRTHDQGRAAVKGRAARKSITSTGPLTASSCFGMGTGPTPPHPLCRMQGKARSQLFMMANQTAANLDDGRCWSISSKGLSLSGWRTMRLEAEARERHQACLTREKVLSAKMSWLRHRSQCGVL
jgi:hypothetical protein